MTRQTLGHAASMATDPKWTVFSLLGRLSGCLVAVSLPTGCSSGDNQPRGLPRLWSATPQSPCSLGSFASRTCQAASLCVPQEVPVESTGINMDGCMEWSCHSGAAGGTRARGFGFLPDLQARTHCRRAENFKPDCPSTVVRFAGFP